MGAFEYAHRPICDKLPICRQTILTKPCYLFLDEGGDLGFSTNGSRYFTLTCLATFNPMAAHLALHRYRYECLASERGLELEYFHCADDNRHIRRKVFEFIAAEQDSFRYDALVVEKRKAHPKVQAEERFYPEMLGHLLRHVITGTSKDASHYVVVTDQLPLKSKKRAIEKGIRTRLPNFLPADVTYRLFHHSSRAHTGLQIADYVNWALFRKWERGETEFFDLIKPRLMSEFDIFRSGTIYHY